MGTDPRIDGLVSEGFEAVAQTFARNFAEGGEIGAACSVYLDGKPVLDVWGGVGRSKGQAPWAQDTLTPVFSVTKGVSALCVLSLVDQGLLELDAPLARYWPEFAAHGKGSVTVRQALAHRAGVPFVEGPVSIEDLANPAGMAARLAQQEPYFPPGASHLYHAWTVSWITSELVRRATGLSMGPWLRANVAEPLGIDLWMGLPASESDRVARLEDAAPPETRLALMPEGSIAWRTLTMNGALSLVPDVGGDLNTPEVQRLELAGGGLMTNARALAKFYAACIGRVDGLQLISPSTLRDACVPVSFGAPWESDIPGPRWGAGVMVPWEIQPMLGQASFGHDGHGGSLAFADPSLGVSFAYVRNRLAPGGVKDAAVYRVVEEVARAVGA